MDNNTDIKNLIGGLEMMIAAAEPGVVMTEEMSMVCSVTLLSAVRELKRGILNEQGVVG